MNRNTDRRSIRTHPGVIAAAYLLGALSVYYFGFLLIILAHFCGGSNDFALLVITNFMLAVAMSAASMVGLCALLTGAKVGRYFSVTFSLCLASILGAILWCVLHWCDVRFEEGPFTVAYFVWVILFGGIGGVMLAGRITGYHRRSRICATVGVILTLPIVCYSLYHKAGELIENGFTFLDMVYLFLLLSILVFGGVLGAVCGVISDRKNRRYTS